MQGKVDMIGEDEGSGMAWDMRCDGLYGVAMVER